MKVVTIRRRYITSQWLAEAVKFFNKLCTTFNPKTEKLHRFSPSTSQRTVCYSENSGHDVLILVDNGL